MLMSLLYRLHTLLPLLRAIRGVDTEELIQIQRMSPNPVALQHNTDPPMALGTSHFLEDGNSTQDESSQAADGAHLSRTSSDDGGGGARRGVGGARGGAGGVGRAGVRSRGGG